jgi:citrate lyase beta subunit
MRYFSQDDKLKFFREPQSFNKYTPIDVLKYAIGANMYMPATQASVFNKLIENRYHDVGAITLCMEDSIDESQVVEAQECVLKLLNELYVYSTSHEQQNIPLIFVRVRSVQQFRDFTTLLTKEQVKVLSGFTFPKFNSVNGEAYLSALKDLSEKTEEVLYGMPIIEDKEVIYKENRFDELSKIQRILLKYDDLILNIRVGGTDFSSLYGLRRDVNTTIYDLKVVADCLKDILNFFTRYECQYVVSGPVWEYYSWREESREIRSLKQELQLDIQNGFHGKTVIHPSQIDVVNRAYVVKYEDYQDAINILKSKDTGVFAGYSGNRMNEVNPHRNWARKVLAKAEIFGVADKDVMV